MVAADSTGVEICSLHSKRVTLPNELFFFFLQKVGVQEFSLRATRAATNELLSLNLSSEAFPAAVLPCLKEQPVPSPATFQQQLTAGVEGSVSPASSQPVCLQLQFLFLAPGSVPLRFCTPDTNEHRSQWASLDRSDLTVTLVAPGSHPARKALSVHVTREALDRHPRRC